MSKIGSYQNEVTNKTALQSAFRGKVKAVMADPAKVGMQDWSGLALILDELIDTLSSLSSTGSTAGGVATD